MANAAPNMLSHTDYTVACICPMGVELAPVEGMLDEIHDNPPTKRGQNAYTLGRIGNHNVVIAIMPEIGNNTAAAVATQLLNDFEYICFGLLIGVGGGVPGEVDVRLGDVVVSQPSKAFGGVVQYDLGKKLADGKFERTGQLNEPPWVLTSHVRKLEGQHRRVGNKAWEFLDTMFEKYPKMKATYSFPDADDLLFKSSYQHLDQETCESCDPSEAVHRKARPDSEPRIHYGTIGSANVVVKDAIIRDQLKRDMNVLCVEMEAAGMMNSFPCLVVRGICDYADSHKNKKWQPYAAAMAAAYCKELLMIIPAEQLATKQNSQGVTVDTTSEFSLGIHLAGAPEIDSSLFVGRAAELELIHSSLQGDGQTQRRAVLGGIGGVGKTQLSIAYAKKYSHLYESIFWLNASSETTLNNDMGLIARRITKGAESNTVDEHQHLARVLEWLSNPRNARWLLIFDNYDEPDDFDIRKYYPYAFQGNIIITTRLPDKVSGSQVHIGPLESIEESLQVLATRSQRPGIFEDLGARYLAVRLKGLLLALATAGSYLRRSAWTFTQYHKEYEALWNVDARRPLQLEEYRDRTLYTTWDLSYNRLKKEDPDAARLLCLLACFDNQDISYRLFKNSTGNQSDWPLTVPADRNNFESLMGVLSEYRFVEVQAESQSYSMHSCVHDWTLAGLNKIVDAENYWYAFDCIIKQMPSSVGLNHYLRYAYLAPHAERLVHPLFLGSSCWSNVPLDRCDQATKPLSELLDSQDRRHASIALLKKVVVEYERQLPPGHLSILHVLKRLGAQYQDENRLDKAEQMFSRAMKEADEHLGPGEIMTVDIVSYYAILKMYQGNFYESEELLSRAIHETEEILGPNHGKTLVRMGILGHLYFLQDRMDDAEAQLDKTFQQMEIHLGPEHYNCIRVLEQKGNTLRRQGRLAEAAECYKTAARRLVNICGPDHKETRDARWALCYTYWRMNKLDDAEDMALLAIESNHRMRRDGTAWAVDAETFLQQIRRQKRKATDPADRDAPNGQIRVENSDEESEHRNKRARIVREESLSSSKTLV